MINSDTMIFLIALISVIFLFSWRYKRTHYLAKITNKINIANKEFYLDIALMSGYKRIKVSQEVFEYYNIGDRIIW